MKTDIATDTLLQVSSDVSSLVIAIQALAREREDEEIFAHIVTLTDITIERIDQLYGGVAQLQMDLAESASSATRSGAK